MRCGKVLLFMLVIIVLSSFVIAAEVEELVDEHLDSAGLVDVIVILKDSKLKDNLGSSTAKFKAQKEMIKDKQDKVLKTVGEVDFKKKHQFSTINGFSGEVNENALEQLRNDPDVEKILYNKILTSTLVSSKAVTKADEVLERQISSVNITGAGVTVCVVDSGIDYTHPDLGGCLGDGCKVRGGYDFVNSDSDPADDQGHGTHVAGIVAANGTVIGVAPGADLIAIKSMNDAQPASGSDADIAAGIDWCVNNATEFNISIITLSLGNSVQYTAATCPVGLYAIESSIAAAHAAGIIVTVASGNDGYSSGISYPACSPNVTSVASASDADVMSSFSNTGTNLDIVAPGSSIVSAAWGGGTTSMSGTSMATPHVAGAAALIVQERRLLGLSDLDHDSMEQLLINSSLINVTDGFNFPRIDVFNALNDGCDKSPGMQTLMSYTDYDSDGYGVDPANTTYCFAPLDFVLNTDDCNDTSSSVYPGATEIACDGIDQSCSGSDFLGTDLDSDNFTEEGGFCGETDCNDADASINPNATEIPCDGIDQNCSGGDYTGTDLDLDGFSLEGGLCGTADCDDANSSINANATEVCNYVDDDCDSVIDNGVTTVFYEDLDGDAYGNLTSTYYNCSAAAGFVVDSGDCNDGNNLIAPNATETLNGLDDNCNNMTDEGLVDGNETTIGSTSVSDFNVSVNSSYDLSQVFTGSLAVVLYVDNNTGVEFTHDFDTDSLNLSDIAVEIQTSSDLGYIIVKNVTGTKTVYIDDLNSSNSGVCIKDAEVDLITEVSTDCNGTNEYSVDCSASGYTANGYTCTDLGSRLKIESVNHSAVIEFASCTDADGDGYGTGCALGTDCDDSDDDINPGETEVCGDGKDNDCSAGDAACASTRSSGGGGGGGGASMSGNFSATGGSSETRYFVTIVAGESNSMKIVRDELSVTNIDFVSKNDNSLVKVKVAKTDRAPDASSDVYEYFEVMTEGIDDFEIDSASVEFEVPNSFVKEGYEVVLLRHDVVWAELETEKIGADLYRAITPGFSYFAISLKESEVVEEVQDVVELETAEAVEDVPVTEEVLDGSEFAGHGVVDGDYLGDEKSYSGVILLIVLAALALIFFKFRCRSKIKKKNRRLFN